MLAEKADCAWWGKMHIWETSEQDDYLSNSDHVWGRYLGTEKKEHYGILSNCKLCLL